MTVAASGSEVDQQSLAFENEVCLVSSSLVVASITSVLPKVWREAMPAFYCARAVSRADYLVACLTIRRPVRCADASRSDCSRCLEFATTE